MPIRKIDPAELNWREAHKILTSVIVPRPIGFVSTIGEDDVFNLAPFSFFAGICIKPMYVGFSIERKKNQQKKDTLINIEFSKTFVVNVVTEILAEAMNKASQDYPSHVDEFKEIGLTPLKADIVKSPMVAESPINLECCLVEILEFGDASKRSNFIVGEVVRIHIKDELNFDDEIKPSQLKAIGKLGGAFYCRTMDMFEMKRPGRFN
jgi:flavin reductase (DIM6/NTAB) family NADH-FMN oxidoreductase RutF